MEDLKKLLAAATPGPWTHASDKLAAGNIKAPDNAALIVAAINAMPELLARLERYDDALDEIAAHYNGGITGPGRLQADSMREIARAALKETGQ
jgi:cell division protein ZapA (FtsZ GTPase activity inhibitor)